MRNEPTRTVRWQAVATPIALAPVLLILAAFAKPETGRTAPPEPERLAAPLYELEARAAVIDLGLSRVDDFYLSEVAPVERILGPYHRDAEHVRRISVALVREGRRVGMDPRALASVLLVENPWLAPEIESFVGAVGLMQVMPFHAGRWGCPSDDLTNVEANICHGARIFESYLSATGGDMDRALLKYNGCVRGTNTPDCHMYPSHVYSRAGRAMMRSWMQEQ